MLDCIVVALFTKAVSHLLQWLLNCLNFQQKEDEAERKRGEKEMQDEKRSTAIKLNVLMREHHRRVTVYPSLCHNARHRFLIQRLTARLTYCQHGSSAEERNVFPIKQRAVLKH